MPFDVPFQARAAHLARPDRSPAPADAGVALWLFGLCGMILVMVSLGGATRLTGSGLSIMEWAPIMGTLPPLSDAEWSRLYALYQKIPQYSLVNQGFGLEGFKQIFWLEWAHRLWGRLMGAAFLLPLAYFIVRRRIGRRLALRLLGLFVLGGLQGLVGWIMVASGFEPDRTAVSPYKLVAHLTLAVALYAAILWTALGLVRTAQGGGDRAVRRMAGAVCALVAATMLAGGFVAGLKAGLTYNSFPFMDGRLVPDGYGVLRPPILNLFENVAAVQFNHRLLATATAALAVATVLFGLGRTSGVARAALLALGGAVLVQYGLGVATLLWAVPLGLGVLHQAVAMLVLTAALVLVRVLGPGASPAPGRVPG